MDLNETTTTFTDSLGYEHEVEIEYSPDEFLNITSYYGNRPSGYIHITINSNKGLFLNAIYCYEEFRGRGIASKLNSLAMLLLKKYKNHIIHRIYNPTSLSTDRNKENAITYEELDQRARAFYKSNGYNIIDYGDIQKYPYLNTDINLFDELDIDGKTRSIVIREISDPSEETTRSSR